MNLIRTGMLSGIAVVIKIITLLGINKVLALYVGPVGYAALGQFQNAIQMVSTFTSGAVNVGVTKYTAEYIDDEPRQHRVWSSATVIAFSSSMLAAFFILILQEKLAAWFLKDTQYSGVFVCFAISLVLFNFNTFLLSVLNGKKEIKSYVLANIVGSVFSLLATALMTIWFGLYGALIALAVYQSLSFFATLYLCLKKSWFKFSHFLLGLDRSIVSDLAKYMAMAITTAVCVPFSHIIIRDMLGQKFGWQTAGYWEAMWRLSAAYLMLLTSTLSVYFLPKISELKKASDIKNEVLRGYKIILPVTAVCSLIIYLLRDFIVLVLFSKEFYPMRDLFAWQMLGDFLKIGGWILAYIMLGKAMAKLFIFSEIAFSLLFVGLSWLLTNLLGVEGVVVSHAINYFLYWIVMIFFIWRKMLSVERKL